MKSVEGRKVQCGYTGQGKRGRPQKPLLKSKSISGRPLTARFVQTIFPPKGFQTKKLEILTIVHLLGIPSETGGRKPIVEQEWINRLFRSANKIWSQACISLFPLRMNELIPFDDILTSGFISCLDSEEMKKIEPYHIENSPNLLVNLYLTDFSSGSACGDPFNGVVIIPTQRGRAGPEFMGKILAHEIGHILLNPLGVDDSDNPRHLMFHPKEHPEIPQRTMDSLSMSDCLGAQMRAKELLLIDPSPEEDCWAEPRLGNDLYLIKAEIAEEIGR